MPLNETSLQKSNAQTGIKSPVTSIPAPSGVTSSSYPAPTKSYASNNQSPTGNKNNLWNLVTQSLTPAQQAQWTDIGKDYQNRSKSRQQNLMDNDKTISGTAYNNSLNKTASTDAAGKGIELYSILTPEQQQLWKNAEKAEEGGSFLQGIMPLLALGLAFVGGEALMGVGGAGAGAGASTAAADGLSYVATTGLPEYASLGTEMAASTTAAGEVAASTVAESTLAETLVTASASSGLLTTAEVAAGAAAGIGGTAAMTGGTSAGGMPAVNAPPGGGLSQYLPKNMISSGLKKAGMNAIPANILGSAGQGSIMSLITGGDPLKGAISGGLSSGISQGLQAWEASTGALDVLGNSGIAAVNGAVTGASTSFILGGKNPLQSGLMGAAGGFGGSIMSEIMGGSSGNGKIGQFLGAQAGQMAMASILNQGTPSHVVGQNKRPAAAVTPQQTIPSALTTPTVNPITASTVTPPHSPFYGVGYGGGGGGNVASSGDDSSYWGDDQQKLKQLMAALQQQGGVYG